MRLYSMLTKNEYDKRIEELENGLKEILKANNVETIKDIAAELVGEEAEDWIEEDFLDLDNDTILDDEVFFDEEKYYD